MGQLTDISYSTLKENERAYEVMLLRDLYDNTYTDIAKKYSVSLTKIVPLYHKAKIKQFDYILDTLQSYTGMRIRVLSV